jgi:ribosome modulation factor
MTLEVPTIMKRQKRNPVERAFSKGYQAAMSGKSWSACPFETGEARQTWMSGWREAREDHWSGYNTRTQAHKLSNF